MLNVFCEKSKKNEILQLSKLFSYKENMETKWYTKFPLLIDGSQLLKCNFLQRGYKNIDLFLKLQFYYIDHIHLLIFLVKKSKNSGN